MNRSRKKPLSNFALVPRALDLIPISPAAWIVYAALCGFRDHQTHRAFPTIREIVEASGTSERSVKRAIHDLEADLWLLVPIGGDEVEVLDPPGADGVERKVPKWILASRALCNTAKRLATLIGGLSHCRIYPGNSWYAEKLGVTERRIKRLFRELEAAGAIVGHRRDHLRREKLRDRTTKWELRDRAPKSAPKSNVAAARPKARPSALPESESNIRSESENILLKAQRSSARVITLLSLMA